MFSSDVVAFKCHFSFYMQRKSEKERRHVELKNIYRFKKEKTFQSKKEGSASHSILLSTVQYLYVHPIVLTGVALSAGIAEKKKEIAKASEAAILVLRDVSRETVRTQHT